jgi:protocatechuate 3,4-dioxygenase beta subunit
MSTPPDDRDVLDRFIRRREALIALGAMGAGAALLGKIRLGAGVPLFDTPQALAANACTLDPEVTQGPYHIDYNVSRRDIREDRKGLLLNLTLTVVNASTCKPIQGADVEIWHADAGGAYSGFGSSPGAGTNSKRYLRGHQKANADGQVRFLTIYPGWYSGRTPHIHLLVSVGGNRVHTGQLFFRDATSSKVYDTSAYKSHGHQNVLNGSDSIYKQAGGAAALVALKRRSANSLARGLNGAATLAVKT